MRFGIFHEHRLRRPWTEDSELTLFQNALEQCELADRLGIEYWAVARRTAAGEGLDSLEEIVTEELDSATARRHR